MFLLTETTLFHWDLASDLLSARLDNVKKGFSGAITARKVQTWFDKAQTKGLPSRSAGSLGSSNSYATTIANTDATASSGAEPPITPKRTSMGGLHYRRLGSEECDGAYRKALANLPKDSPQDPSAVSDSCQSLQRRLFTH